MRKITRPSCPNPQALATDYKNTINKEALVNASFGKCMYCESKVLHISFGDVEHIKPKSRYPLLEFEWNNLGLVCTKCNNAKRDKYSENTPYINPYVDDPEDHILALGALLKHKNGSERGELTIHEIELNRAELIEKRQTKLDMVQKTIDACSRTQDKALKALALDALMNEATEDKEYSLVIKTLFKLHGLN